MSAAEARDPFKYFRVEARELCDALQRGALGLEKAAPSPDAAAALLRQAHTLKGAARIVRLPAVAELAHQVEAELEPLRRGQAPPLGLTGRLLALLDAIDAALASAGLAPAATTATATTAAAAPLRRGLLRLEAWELDEVMEGQREASARLAQLRRQALGLAHARSLAHGLAGAEAAPAAWKAEAQALDAWLERFDRVSLAALDQAVRELESAHAEAGRMRLAPAADLFHFLERACHDAAEALGKPVTFTAAGGMWSETPWSTASRAPPPASPPASPPAAACGWSSASPPSGPCSAAATTGVAWTWAPSPRRPAPGACWRLGRP
jgi:two-component system chemotaxis sensor kinase CheA